MDSPFQITYQTNTLLFGPSGTGKSTFIEHLLDTPAAWSPKYPDKIIYNYGINSSTVTKLAKKHPNIILNEGLMDLSKPEEIFDSKGYNCVIFDDLCDELHQSPAYTNWLTRISHHMNVATLCTDHHLFSSSKERKKQSVHYQLLVLFPSRRSIDQINVLARQLSLDKNKVISAYKDMCSSKGHSYLLIDLREDANPQLILLSNVLCENNSPCIAYL